MWWAETLALWWRGSGTHERTTTADDTAFDSQKRKEAPPLRSTARPRAPNGNKKKAQRIKKNCIKKMTHKK